MWGSKPSQQPNAPPTRGPRPDHPPPFHPATPIMDLGDGDWMDIDACLRGSQVTGASGAGKTSGIGKRLCQSFLAGGAGGAGGFGMLLTTAKKEDFPEYLRWVREAGRLQDLVVIEPDGPNCFNFLEHEASRSGNSATNIVALLMELQSATSAGGGSDEGGGDGKFWEETQRYLTEEAVNACLLSGMPVTLELLSAVVESSPKSAAQASDPEWRAASVCWEILELARQKTQEGGDSEEIADCDECARFFLSSWAGLSEKTRSIVELTFLTTVKRFLRRPLRRLLAGTTNWTPELLLDGAVILMNMPPAECYEVGRACQVAILYCVQRMILRRPRPAPGEYIRPVAIFSDEFQLFCTKNTASFQAVARSQGCAAVYLTQSRNSYRLALDSDVAVDTLLANLSNKFFCAVNDIGDAEWASKSLGERYVRIYGGSTGVSGHHSDANVGQTWNDQKRAYLEPGFFIGGLRRGGFASDRIVDCIALMAGRRFEQEVVINNAASTESVPYKLLALRQG